MINYEWIKIMAKEMACPVTSLLALARQNDPFYVGGPASQTQAEWFAEIWNAEASRLASTYGACTTGVSVKPICLCRTASHTSTPRVAGSSYAWPAKRLAI